MHELEVLLVSRGKFDSGNAILIHMHAHEFYQFVCVISGSGEILINDNRYIAGQNMIFMIKPDEMHAIYSNEKTPLQVMEVKFKTCAGWIEELFLKNTAVKVDKEYKHIVFLMERIIDEAICKKYMHEKMIATYFLEVLLLITRLQEDSTVSRITQEINLRNKELTADYKMIGKIVEYVNSNFSRKLTVSELSKAFGFTETYLCRLFKKVYGMSMNQYINMLRLNKAKELLMYSTHNITEIAEASGFQSIHYFSRCFSEKEGMSPLGFRRSIKKNVYVFFNKDLSPEYTYDHKRGNVVNDNIYIIS